MQEALAFLQGMESPQKHAGFPRGPYAGNKYAYAIISGLSDQDALEWAAAQPPDAEGNPIEYAEGNYSHPHKIIVIEMKVQDGNVSDVEITLHPSTKPNSLDSTYPPGSMPGANNYSLIHGDNPIATAMEVAVQEIRDELEPAGGAGV